MGSAIVSVIGSDAALTSIVARPTVLLQGTPNILLLVLVAVAITVGDVSFLGLVAVLFQLRH